MTTPPNWGQQYSAPQPPPKKKSWFSRHKILTGALAFFGVIILIVVISSSGKSSTKDDASTATSSDAPVSAKHPAKAAKPKKAAPGIGDTVKDGRFKFVVTSITSKHKVGTEYMNQTAQGKYLLIHVTVTNVGKSSQLFTDSNQELKDAEGRKYDADTSAAIYLGDSNAFLKEINPGNSVKGILLYDVPKDMKPTTIELHDSIFSGGVKVKL